MCMWLIVSILRYLVESLQKCYLLSKQVPKNLDNYSKETTPFNQIFGGYMRQVISCFLQLFHQYLGHIKLAVNFFVPNRMLLLRRSIRSKPPFKKYIQKSQYFFLLSEVCNMHVHVFFCPTLWVWSSTRDKWFEDWRPKSCLKKYSSFRLLAMINRIKKRRNNTKRVKFRGIFNICTALQTKL